MVRRGTHGERLQARLRAPRLLYVHADHAPMTVDPNQPASANPAAESQAWFRALTDAMAWPGRLHAVGAGLTPPAPLHPATAAVLLTLVDGETPLWIDPSASAARDWLAARCGAAFAASPAGCSFALALSLPDLATLPAGGDETPEASATLILQVVALGSGARLRLMGPRLQEPAVLAVDGLTGDFVARWSSNRALYPRGVDLVLCAGTMLAALPRSVTIEAAH